MNCRKRLFICYSSTAIQSDSYTVHFKDNHITDAAPGESEFDTSGEMTGCKRTVNFTVILQPLNKL